MAGARVFLAVLAVFLFSRAASGQTLLWRQPRSSNPPSPRWKSAMAYDSDGNRLLVFGGQSSNETLGDMHEYDISSGSWNVLSSSAISPGPRYGTVGGVMGSTWLLSHGRNETHFFDDTWVFNMTSNEWTLYNTSSEVPRARFGAAGGVYGNSPLLWLNMGLGDGMRLLSDTWVLNTTSGEWVEVNGGSGLNQYDPFNPHARSDHSGAPLSEDTFVMFGGCADGGQVGGPCPLEDTWALSLSNKKWEKVDDECATPRVGGVMVADADGYGIMIQGDQENGPGIFAQRLAGTELDPMEVNEFNLSDRSWRRVLNISASTGFVQQRQHPSVLIVKSTLYIFGGRNTDKLSLTHLNDLWSINLTHQASVGEADCSGFTVTYLDLHGILMACAWLFLLPFGGLLGRYYRWAWPCWFITHVIMQAMGVLFTIAAFIIVFLVSSYDQPNFPHAVIGIVLTAILIQQFLSGIFHPCVESENGKIPSDEKTTYRKCWEVYHGVSAFITIAIGFGQVILGVFLIVLPLYLWALVCGIVLLWILVFVTHEIVFQCYKRCRGDDDKVY